MSADLNSYITIHGTREEKEAMLLALQKFEKESNEQYKAQHDCGYIMGSTVSEMSREEISKLVEKKEINIDITGPYGVFMHPSEVPLFERIADAAPKAIFIGGTSGFVTGARVSTRAVLKHGILDIESFYLDDFETLSSYCDVFAEKIPWEQFCSSFHIDQEAFDKNRYFDWIGDFAGDDSFNKETSYEEFLDMFEEDETPDIEEDEYKEVLKTLFENDIQSFEDYCNELADEPYDVSKYDPTKREYIN